MPDKGETNGCRSHEPAHITLKAALVTLTPVSQENVCQTPNFNKHLRKIIFGIGAGWDTANLDPSMIKIMGALAAVNQVIFPETPGDGAGQTPALDFRLASRHAGSGGELAIVTAFGKKSEREERIFGWDKKDGEMYYYENDGMIQDEFREIDGKKYYFHEDGHMARDEFVH